MINEQKILHISNLKKYFGDVKAVDGLNLDLKAGDVYGLLGPNGAGKTTTVKSILGLLEPDEGEVLVMGLNPQKHDLEIKEKIGYVAEEPLIYKSLTPREMLNFICSIRNLDKNIVTKKIEDLLDSLEAREYYDKPIVTLSKGNKQKMQIIAALIHDPPLLILDEPLSGLDARTSKIIKDIIRLHIQNNGAVLLSTHIMEIAQDLCTKIGIITKGKMVAEGTLSELRTIANQAGAASLEDVFLKLTNADESITKVLQKLKETLK